MILAGGRGRRMGGGKPARMLAGRPLAAYPAAALVAVCGRVVVVCKPSTEVPLDLERWEEPSARSHPAVGIAHALERAGEAVLVCAADMPFVTADACSALIAGLAPGRSASVAFAEGRLQPVFGCYAVAALPAFTAAGEGGGALTAAVASLDPVLVSLPAAVVRSVDTPEDLAAAARQLDE